MLAYFLQGLALGLPAAATPGPFQAYLLSQSLKNGWRRTLPAALAPLFSDGPIVLLVLLILTQTPAWFLTLLKIAGGFFILYLAKGAYDSWRNPAPAIDLSAAAPTQSLREAVLLNLLNPNPYIFWSVVGGPILLEGWRQGAGVGLAYLLGFYGTLVGGFAGFIILFASGRHLGPKINHYMIGFSALALLLFGLYQIITGLMSLL